MTLFSSEAEGQHQGCQAIECNPVSGTVKVFLLLIAVLQTLFHQNSSSAKENVSL